VVPNDVRRIKATAGGVPATVFLPVVDVLGNAKAQRRIGSGQVE